VWMYTQMYVYGCSGTFCPYTRQYPSSNGSDIVQGIHEFSGAVHLTNDSCWSNFNSGGGECTFYVGVFVRCCGIASRVSRSVSPCVLFVVFRVIALSRVVLLVKHRAPPIFPSHSPRRLAQTSSLKAAWILGRCALLVTPCSIRRAVCTKCSVAIRRRPSPLPWRVASARQLSRFARLLAHPSALL
jgi:hypothetical protein